MNAAWLSLQATSSPWGRECARTPDRYVFGTAPSEFARAVAPFVRPGDAVLDLGCGERRGSVFFARLGAVVTGRRLRAVPPPANPHAARRPPGSRGLHGSAHIPGKGGSGRLLQRRRAARGIFSNGRSSHAATGDQLGAGRDDARPRRRGAGGGAVVGASALAVRVVMT